MRLHALCFIGAVTVLGVPLSARAVPVRLDRQLAASAQQIAPIAYTCPPGYYWEPAAMLRMANLGRLIARPAYE
jgi:hypothetical protein